MLSFAWIWLFLLLPLPWLLPKGKPQHRSALKLPQAFAPASRQAHVSQPTRSRSWLAILIWGLLVVAVARPQYLGEPVAVQREGRDLMLALDLSGSMSIEDMQYQGRTVTRYQLVQHLMRDFLLRREGDRVGLILFADAAHLQAPLTFDRTTVARYLDEAELGLVGTQTAIGDAIALSVKRFEQLEQSSRVLVLLTDGQNNAGEFTPEQAVALAKQANVTLYTIGVGAKEINQRGLFGTRTLNPSAELDAAEQTFITLSESTGGRYFRASNSQELAAIYQQLDQLEPIAQDTRLWRPKTELYPWPLSIAIISLLVILWRRNNA